MQGARSQVNIALREMGGMSQSRKRHAGCAQLRPGALPAMSLVIIAAIVADAIVVLSIVIWAFRPD